MPNARIVVSGQPPARDRIRAEIDESVAAAGSATTVPQLRAEVQRLAQLVRRILDEISER